jgi:hypothetical protein
VPCAIAVWNCGFGVRFPNRPAGVAVALAVEVADVADDFEPPQAAAATSAQAIAAPAAACLM